MNRRPLFWGCIALGVGCVAGECVSQDLICPAIVVCFATCLALKYKPFRAWVMPQILLAMGWALMIQKTTILDRKDLRLNLSRTPTLTRALVKLLEDPRINLPKSSNGRPNWKATVEVKLIRQDNLWIPVRGKALLRSNRFEPTNLRREGLLEIEALAQAPLAAAVPGLFDYKDYLKRQNVHFILEVDNPSDIKHLNLAKVGEDPGADWDKRFQDHGARCLKLGFSTEDEALRLLKAMILGSDFGVDRSIIEPFLKSGTLHVFAISGLHITMIVLIWVQLFRCMGCSPRTAWFASTPLVWAYAMATGFDSSAVRAAVMSSVVAGSQLLARPSDPLNSLGFAALLILLWDPQQLWSIGFQLSFVAVGFLIWTYGELHCRMRVLLSRDPLIPKSHESEWIVRSRELGMQIGAVVLTSMVAWAATAPLVAYHFHLINPISILANLVVVPLSSLALSSGIGSVLVGGWIPQLAELFNHSAWFWMLLMMKSSEWFSELPFAFRYVESPHWTTMTISYLGLMAIGWKIFWRRIRIMTFTLIVGLVTCSLIEYHRIPDLRLDILPLSGGETILVTGSSLRGGLLIDCGNSNSCLNVTLPLLRARGLDELDTVVFTHGDIKHVGGAITLLNNIPVKRLVMSHAKSRSHAYHAAVVYASNCGVTLQKTQLGERIGPFQVVHPPPNFKASRADDQALVFELAQNGVSIWLCSDLGERGQLELSKHLTNSHRSTNFVIFGIPSSEEPLQTQLLESFQPQGVWLQTSQFPFTEYPTEQLLSRLKTSVPTIYMAHQHLGLQLSFKGDHWFKQTASEGKSNLFH